MTKSYYNVPQIRAARDAWLAAGASHEVHWLEVTKLWLEYLELADSVRAPKIRKILERAEKVLPRRPMNCSRLRCPLGDRYHGRKSCGIHLPAIIREVLQLRYRATLIKIAY